ncbi:hypothetical protein, partial [Burkholderia multivorans]|uniref:hypothetical protein n=1 Tax=Burkholderia multivorans TaxID=87883 RepID=UPI001C615C42
NSYVNLKIATCLVRYADDRLIDQRFPSTIKSTIATGMKTLNIASSSPSFNHIRKIPEIKKAKKAEISIEKRPVVTPISSVAYSLRQFTFYLPRQLASHPRQQSPPC